MQYPLNLSFKVMALAPQLSVTDASGQQIFYVKQKLFKLKEAVNVFADSAQTRQLYTINADRILDFSAQYHFSDDQGRPLMRLVKQPAFFEGKFKIEKLAELQPAAEIRILLSLLMMVLLERARGWSRNPGPYPITLQ